MAAINRSLLFPTRGFQGRDVFSKPIHRHGNANKTPRSGCLSVCASTIDKIPRKLKLLPATHELFADKEKYPDFSDAHSAFKGYMDLPGEMKIAVWEFKEGDKVGMHSHKGDVSQSVLEGLLRYTFEEDLPAIELGPGDIAFIPGGFRYAVEALKNSTMRPRCVGSFYGS